MNQEVEESASNNRDQDTYYR